MQNTFETLAEVRPPRRKWRFFNAGKGNVEKDRLERALGREPSKPIFNMGLLNEYVDKLTSEHAARGVSTAAPSTALADALASNKPSEQLSASNAASAAERNAAPKIAKVAESLAANPDIMTAAQFRLTSNTDRADRGLEGRIMSKSDFDSLSVKGKADFMRGGGRLADVSLNIREPIPASAPSTETKFKPTHGRLLY